MGATKKSHHTGRPKNSLNVDRILTNAQTKLFNMCNERHQARFQPGAFALCNFFIELLLDPKLNPTKNLTGLFEDVEHQDFACRSAEPCLVPQIQSLTPIKIELKNFLENGLNPSDVLGLILLWTTTGLSETPGLSQRPEDVNSTAEYVRETSWLGFKDNLPPQHLYFFMEVTQPSDPIEQEQYMGAMDWPYQITISGVKFTLFSRGYWNGCHYWCRQCHPFTSWLFYTRVWTSGEKEHVKSAIAKISNANPNAKGDIPFVHLAGMINPNPQNSLHTTIPSLDPLEDRPIKPLIVREGYVVDEFDILDSSNVDDASEEAQDQKDSAGKSDSSNGKEDLSDSSAGSSPESDSEEAKAVRTASIPKNKVPVSTADISARPNPIKPPAKQPITLKLKLSQVVPEVSSEDQVDDPA
ncbi:hypothetical protein PTTG_29868 [Puccinia triticina 1-1 BBBD Race 1]|uniref:Uncharacterized protein n=1 Tax=Puccinia triticina (isolate 1-1 / race 1 (BBBD)) TaxID=630390 RepID=A0A180G1D4_PUCT1|nr:hypothetical protein PTTG_29868 [Puccinia triticina 1-1 BBBD Race 1]